MNSKLSVFTKILVLISLLYCSSCNNSRKCALNNRLFVKVKKKSGQKFTNKSSKIKSEKQVYSFYKKRGKHEAYTTNENIAENRSSSQQDNQILADNVTSQMNFHSVESYAENNTPRYQFQNKLENDKKDKQSLRIKTFSKIGLALAIIGLVLVIAGFSLGLIWIPLITIGAFVFLAFEIIALVFSIISYCTIRNKIDEDIQNEKRLKQHKRMSIAGIILGSIFLYIALLLSLVVLFVYLL